MPGRTGKLALVAGFVLLLVLVVGLVQMTRSTTQAAPSPRASRDATAPAAPTTPITEAPPPAAPAPAAPEQGPAPAAPRGRVTMPVKQPELALAQVSFTRELKRDADGKLVPIVTVKELREQFHRTDAPMKACVERLGQRANGKATLNFTVGAKNNKLIIDTTGVQDEETLAGSPELLECMHQTATALVLDGHAVPELGTPIYVRRHVRIENGELAENSIFNFSYHP